MPRLYRFGFENSTVPSGVTVHGEYSGVSETVSYDEYPLGTIDLLFVFDLTTADGLAWLDQCITGSASFVKRYSLLSSTRYGVATIGQDNGHPYLNFYGWTDNTDNPASTPYFFQEDYSQSDSNFEAVLKTARREARLAPADASGLTIDRDWVHFVLIPFLYGRFSSGFRYWSMPQQTTPLAAIVPEPSLPKFYIRDSASVKDGNYTLYNPTISASPVQWGFRYNNRSWQNNQDATVYRGTMPAYTEGNWYAESVFITPNPELWQDFATVANYPTLVARDLPSWSEHHYLSVATDTSKPGSDYFNQYFSTGIYGGVLSLSPSLLTTYLGANDIFARKSQIITGTALSGNADLDLDSTASIFCRYSIFQYGDSTKVTPITGAYTCFSGGGLNATVSAQHVDISFGQNLILSQDIPALIQGIVYDTTLEYGPDGFDFGLDGNKFKAQLSLPVLTSLNLAGLPMIDNVAINSGDSRYARRYNTDYDENSADFDGEDMGMPDPVQCFNINITPRAVKSSTIDSGSIDMGSDGYAVAEFGTVDYPWLSIEGINAVARVARLGTDITPVELDVQHGVYRRPVSGTARLSHTPRLLNGSVFYDETAKPISASTQLNQASLRVSTGKLLDGMLITYYAGLVDINVEPPISDITSEFVSADASHVSDLGQISGLVRLSAYTQSSDDISISSNAVLARLYVDNQRRPDLEINKGFHRVDLWLCFESALPSLSFGHDVIFQYDKQSDHFDPALHGWTLLGNLSVDKILPDIVLDEGEPWQYTIPDSAFAGVGASTVFDFAVTVVATDVTPTSWLSFNPSTKTLTGTPTNSDVGTFSVRIGASDDTGIKVSQSFKVVVNNVNTAPYAIATPAPIAYEESTAYFDLSSYVTDDDIVHGDSLTFKLYQQDLIDSTALIGKDCSITVVADSSGTARDTALTVMTMVNSGEIYSSLSSYYGVDYSEKVSFSYANSSWRNALTPTRSKSVNVYVGGDSYQDSTTIDDLVTAVGNTEQYYAIILDTGGLSTSYQAAMLNSGFSQLVNSGKLVYIPAVEKNREENYYYVKIITALARLGLYIEPGYSAIPAWMSTDGPICQFSPAYNQVGTFPLVARVTDSSGLYTDVRFNLTVRPIEHPIVATQTMLTYTFYHGVHFSQSLPYCFSDLDASRGDTATLSVVNQPSWLSLSGRQLYGVPPSDSTDTYTFLYQAVDRTANRAQVTVTLVAGAMPYVTMPAPDISMHYTETRQIDLSSVFRYVNQLRYGVAYYVNNVEDFKPDWITLTSTGLLTIQPGEAFISGSFDLVLSATADDIVQSVYDSVHVTVVNDSPYFSGSIPDRSVDYNTGSVSYSLSGFVDPEGRPLTYSYSGPDFLSLSGTVLSGSITKSNIGKYSLVLSSTDEGGKTATASTHLEIYNLIPVLNLADISTGIDKDISIDVSHGISNEENVSTCQYSITLSGPNTSWLTVDGSKISGSTSLSTLGTVAVHVVVTDEVGQSSSSDFNIVVYRTPHLVTPIPDVNLNYLVPWSVDVGSHFDINQGITWQVTGLPAWLSFDSESTLITGTPPKADVGSSYTVTVNATEIVGEYVNSSSTTFKVNVVNRLPYCTGFENKTVNYASPNFSYDIAACFNDDDVDAYDELIWTVDAPDWLNFDQVTKVLSFAPVKADVGSHLISIAVKDSFGSAATGSFTLAVVNTPPFVVNQPGNVSLSYRDTAVVNLVNTFSDQENPSTLTVTCQVPSWMTWDGSNQRLIIAPSSANVGQTRVELIATDECGSVISASFMVTVTNQLPTGSIPDQTVLAGTDFLLDVKSLFSDPENDSITLAFSGLPVWLVATNGVLSGSPGVSQVGVSRVTATITDAAGGVSTSSFSLTVYTVTNKPPEVYRLLEDQITYELSEWTYNITGYFVDPDDDSSKLVYTVTWKDSSGLAINCPSWINWDATKLAFTGLPPEGSAGTVYTATVKAAAPDGRYASDSFNVVVYGMTVLLCGKYYKDTDFGGSKPGPGQAIVKKILLGNLPGSVSVSFDAYTYYDSFSLYYNGVAVPLVDTYDSKVKTVISVGRNNPNETNPASSSKTIIWSYPASGPNYVLLKIYQGPDSTDWRFRLTCPV